ncbi:MAG: thioesterase family protein [Acidobacteriota bacterium]|nr:MAG: acyl-CoA thioesterase [Acidobacteriota bacterium]
MSAHCTTVRVGYPEVDRMGFAHHSRYPVWFEIGRTELMRAAGLPYVRLEEELGLMFPVVELGARYRRPARYDELLTVRTVLAGLAGVRVRFRYRIEGPDGTGELARGFTEHASCGLDGRPRRIPVAVREILAPWVDPAAEEEP